MTFSDFQNEIYLAGMAGTRPDLPLTSEDLQAAAREALPPEAYAYVAGSAGSEDTARENLEAFRRWRLVPRMLGDVSVRDLTTEVLGTPMPAPVLLAPVGVLGIVHPDGELAVARAAAGLGVPMVLSTVSSTTMEEVANAGDDAPRWFQLYWPNDPDLAGSFLDRAGAAGFSAVVVTIDTRFLAWRPRDLANAYLPFLRGEGIATYLADPVFMQGVQPEDDPQAAVLRWAGAFPHPTSTWEQLGELRSRSRLPMLVKGVLHPDDARRAVEAGMDGVIVSNHGGRQVDGEIASLDALPAVVDAVGDRTAVLLDSGIRTGADVLKAVALGALAVLLGRPYVWGLGLAGEAGVRHVLRSILADLDLTLGLCGLRSIGDVDRDLVVRRDPR